VVQRQRLEHQAGEEVQNVDEDFLEALEYGMPSAGWNRDRNRSVGDDVDWGGIDPLRGALPSHEAIAEGRRRLKFWKWWSILPGSHDGKWQLRRNFRLEGGSGKSVAEPKRAEALPGVEPLYLHVVLHDDDDHTYDYVIEMLRAIFGYDLDKAYAMTREVDMTGRVIVATVHKELAELR